MNTIFRREAHQRSPEISTEKTLLSYLCLEYEMTDRFICTLDRHTNRAESSPSILRLYHRETFRLGANTSG